MKKHLILMEKLFTVIALIIYTGAILSLVVSGGIQENEAIEYDSSIIRFIYFLIYIATFFLLVLRWRKSMYFLNKFRWVFPLLIFAVCSLFWSFDQATTLKDTFTLIGSSSFGLYLASRYTLKEQLHLLAWTFAINIILSIVFVIVLPKYGTMGGIHQGKWRGVFLHKNGLGSVMMYSSMVFLILSYQSKKYKLLLYTGLSVSILLMLISSSSSATINLIILMFACFIFQIVRLPYLVMMPISIMVMIAGGLLYFVLMDNASYIFESIGKDSTLTGRTQLWPLVIDMIWKHPWIGYGYGGFWKGLDGESAYVLRGAGWLFNHPHNGYLALWLDLGFLGMGLFLIAYLRSFSQALYWVRISKIALDIFPLISIIYVAIASLTESSLLQSNSLAWILYISSSIYVSEKLDCIQHNISSSEKVSIA
jgi:exopolysaccharide production protein ExoQ